MNRKKSQTSEKAIDATASKKLSLVKGVIPNNIEDFSCLIKPEYSPLGIYAFHSQPPHIPNLQAISNTIQHATSSTKIRRGKCLKMIRDEIYRRKLLRGAKQLVASSKEHFKNKKEKDSDPMLQIPKKKRLVKTLGNFDRTNCEEMFEKKANSTDRTKDDEENLKVMWKRKLGMDESDVELEIVDYVKGKSLRKKESRDDTVSSKLKIMKKKSVNPAMAKTSTVGNYDPDFGNAAVFHPIMTMKEKLMLGLIPEHGWKKKAEQQTQRNRPNRKLKNTTVSKGSIGPKSENQSLSVKKHFERKGILEITAIKIVEKENTQSEIANAEHPKILLESACESISLNGLADKTVRRYISEHEEVAQAQKNLKNELLQNLPNPNFELKNRTGRKEYKLRDFNLKLHTDVEQSHRQNIETFIKPNVLNSSSQDHKKDIIFMQPSTPSRARKQFEDHAKQKHAFDVYQPPATLAAKSVPIPRMSCNNVTVIPKTVELKLNSESMDKAFNSKEKLSLESFAENAFDGHIYSKGNFEQIHEPCVDSLAENFQMAKSNDYSDTKPIYGQCTEHKSYQECGQDIRSSGDATYRASEPFFGCNFNPRPQDHFGPFIYSPLQKYGISHITELEPTGGYFFYDVPYLPNSTAAFNQEPITNEFIFVDDAFPNYVEPEIDVLPKSSIVEISDDQIVCKNILPSTNATKMGLPFESLQDNETINTHKSYFAEIQPKTDFSKINGYNINTDTLKSEMQNINKSDVALYTNYASESPATAEKHCSECQDGYHYKTTKDEASNRTLHYRFPLDENGSEVTIDVILPFQISPDDSTLDSPKIACAILEKAQDVIKSTCRDNNLNSDSNCTSVVPMWCAVDIQEIFNEVYLPSSTIALPLKCPVNTENKFNRPHSSDSTTAVPNSSLELNRKAYVGKASISEFRLEDEERSELTWTEVKSYDQNNFIIQNGYFSYTSNSTGKTNTLAKINSISRLTKEILLYLLSCGCFRKAIKVSPTTEHLENNDDSDIICNRLT